MLDVKGKEIKKPMDYFPIIYEDSKDVRKLIKLCLISKDIDVELGLSTSRINDNGTLSIQFGYYDMAGNYINRPILKRMDNVSGVLWMKKTFYRALTIQQVLDNFDSIVIHPDYDKFMSLTCRIVIKVNVKF